MGTTIRESSEMSMEQFRMMEETAAMIASLEASLERLKQGFEGRMTVN